MTTSRRIATEGVNPRRADATAKDSNTDAKKIVAPSNKGDDFMYTVLLVILFIGTVVFPIAQYIWAIKYLSKGEEPNPDRIDFMKLET
mmetsp:Transcript_27604/g.33534  ORF Transcript_27604/g.33534 Transcript_27604/m.33534 type:complete len:88 (+) Transcript_27604:207-470(+)